MNSSADANVSGCNLRKRISDSSDSRHRDVVVNNEHDGRGVRYG